jgi:hypothetical protein
VEALREKAVSDVLARSSSLGREADVVSLRRSLLTITLSRRSALCPPSLTRPPP